MKTASKDDKAASSVAGRSRKVLVLHGPNLNLLGSREPEIYGAETLPDINKRLAALALKAGAKLDSFQSNSEAELVERVRKPAPPASTLSSSIQLPLHIPAWRCAMHSPRYASPISRCTFPTCMPASRFVTTPISATRQSG